MGGEGLASCTGEQERTAPTHDERALDDLHDARAGEASQRLRLVVELFDTDTVVEGDLEDALGGVFRGAVLDQEAHGGGPGPEVADEFETVIEHGPGPGVEGIGVVGLRGHRLVELGEEGGNVGEALRDLRTGCGEDRLAQCGSHRREFDRDVEATLGVQFGGEVGARASRRLAASDDVERQCSQAEDVEAEPVGSPDEDTLGGGESFLHPPLLGGRGVTVGVHQGGDAAGRGRGRRLVGAAHSLPVADRDAAVRLLFSVVTLMARGPMPRWTTFLPCAYASASAT